MAPHHTYRQSTAASWTRIDLLLTVYEIGMETARRGRAAAASGDQSALTQLQLRMQQVIVAILDGLDNERREMTEPIQRLCLFMLERIQQGEPADWDAVLRVLSPLCEGFSGIREQAAELEARGEIPPVDTPLYVSAIA